MAEQKINGHGSPMLSDRFISILGHDLRNPISSIIMASEILVNSSLDEELLEVAQTIKRTAFRMSALVENVLDFSRSHLGEGIMLKRQTTNNFGKSVEQLLREIKIAHPEQEIIKDFQLESPVNCDVARMDQVISNLLLNAILHGEPGKPVYLNVKSNAEELCIEVINEGNSANLVDFEKMREPFYQSGQELTKKGLGLGLYIISRIVKAHGGTFNLDAHQRLIKFSVAIPSA